jgi:hypothetical protein
MAQRNIFAKRDATKRNVRSDGWKRRVVEVRIRHGFLGVPAAALRCLSYVRKVREG